jgi:hypothetical protein
MLFLTSSRPFVELLSIAGIRSNKAKNIQADAIVSPICEVLYRNKRLKHEDEIVLIPDMLITIAVASIE